MENIIIVVVIGIIVIGAILYIRKQKKKGIKCVGCSESKTCSGCK